MECDRSRISNQLPTRPFDDIRSFGDLLLRKRPISHIDRITDSREVSRFIARPELRAENDMLVLCAVWDLDVVS